MTNTACSLGTIQNPLIDKPLGMTVREFLNWLEVGGLTLNVSGGVSWTGMLDRIKRRPRLEHCTSLSKNDPYSSCI